MVRKTSVFLCVLALLGLGLLITFSIEAAPTSDAAGRRVVSVAGDACTRAATKARGYADSAGLPIEEGFEGGEVPPLGWEVVQTNARETWEIHNPTDFPLPHEGTFAARVDPDVQLELQNEVLLTPPFQASVASLEFFSFGSSSWCRDGVDHCNLNVWLVEGDWDGVNDLMIYTADDSWLGDFVWSPGFVDLTPHLQPGMPVRVGFQYEGQEGERIGLDAIFITGTEVISGELNGYVLDDNTGEPTCTEARVRAEPGSYETVADPSGFYSLILPWGPYTVTAEADGYQPETVQVFVSDTLLLVSDTLQAVQDFSLMAPAITSQFTTTAELQGCVAMKIGDLENWGGVTMTIMLTITPPLTDLAVYAQSTSIAPYSSTAIIAHTPPNSALPSPATTTLVITANAPCDPPITESLRFTVAQEPSTSTYIYLPAVIRNP